MERKAFGEVGFDAVDQSSGTLPDWSQNGWPLVEFVLPGGLVTFDGDVVVHHTQADLNLGRYLAAAIAFLCSDDARDINGTVVDVNGGLHIGRGYALGVG